MKIEHLVYAAILYVALHWLLAKQNLSPTARALIEPIENKALTSFFADLIPI